MKIPIGNEASLQASFKSAFEQLSLLGQNVNKLTDCSDVIPEPPKTKIQAAHFPAGLSNSDIEQAVRHLFKSVQTECLLTLPISAPLLHSLRFPLPPVRPLPSLLRKCNQLSTKNECDNELTNLSVATS